MWQKPARAILNVYDAFRKIMGFFFVCFMSGFYGFLVHECFRKKTDLTEKVTLGILTVPVVMILGILIYGIMAASRQTKELRRQRIMCGLGLFLLLASILAGCFIDAHNAG
jgi:uncharacterized membrane protein